MSRTGRMNRLRQVMELNWLILDRTYIDPKWFFMWGTEIIVLPHSMASRKHPTEVRKLIEMGELEAKKSKCKQTKMHTFWSFLGFPSSTPAQKAPVFVIPGKQTSTPFELAKSGFCVAKRRSRRGRRWRWISTLAGLFFHFNTNRYQKGVSPRIANSITYSFQPIF